MSEGTAVMERECVQTDEEHWDSNEPCDCPETPDGPPETDEETAAKFKKYGLTPIEWTPEREEEARIRRIKRRIEKDNAYYASLPPETEEEKAEFERQFHKWEKLMEEVSKEQSISVLKLGQWFHDEPYTAPDNTIEGFSCALECLGVSFRFDVRKGCAEMYHEEFGTWRNMDERLAAELREVMAKRMQYEKRPDVMAPLRFTRESWDNTLNAYLYHREVDPFKEWQENLPRWDGVKRARGWLSKVFTIKDTEGLAEWASVFILLGEVKRTFEPGAKLDEMPVLIGRGGIGKSTALRYILPQELPGLFSDALNLAGTPQERAESMQGRAIVEASELAGATRADNASLKTFLSRVDDGVVRLAYRRNPEIMLRRAIIVGTSDVPSPLPNDRNLRRWVPINLSGGNPAKLRKYIDANREQLWAEALSMYRDGVEARLPDNLIKAQAKATGAARSRDVALEDAVEEFIALRNEPFTIARLAESIKLVEPTKGSRLPMNDLHRLGAVLDGKGYSKKRVRDEDGALKWKWHTWEKKEKEVKDEEKRMDSDKV